MAMEDPRVLLPINMSFNPFRSTSHHASKHQSDDPENDDWHTNHDTSSSIHNHENNNIPPPSYRSSTALSWIQSWTTSSLSITKTTSSSSPQQRRASSSAIIIQDDELTTTTTHSSSIPSVHKSPAKSMTMHRGMGTSPKSEEYQTTCQTIDNTEVHNNNSIPPLPLHIKPGEVSGGRKNGSDSDTSIEDGEEDRTNNDIDSLHELPPYPQPRTAAPRTQTIDATPRTNKPLLEDFPPPKHNVTTEINGRTNSGSSSLLQSGNKQQIILKKEETTFPGFALYETAKAQYCQGKYSEAVDTTTECLAFQKLALSAGSATATAAAQAAKEAASNSKESTPISTSVPANPNDTMMTPLDLRSTFVTGAASSMLNVVQSLKTDNSPKMMMGQRKLSQQHPHPMLSNSIATLVSQYPTHPCVAQTLLLRGHVLAELYRYDDDDDLSLLVQAVQHVEMSVAILRKLSITDEELGLPLVYLGNLKTQLGQFNDADMIFKEAVCILKNVQTNVKQSHLYALQTEEDDEVISDCARYLKQITNEISHALYLYGKAYHTQRMHVQAFDCYNQALRLLRKNSVSSAKNRIPEAKNVIRCMKSRCALEKLVSSYWDDVGVV